MRPTRKIIVEFIGVFVVGCGAGGLVTWSYTNTEDSDLQYIGPPPPSQPSSEASLSTFMSRTNNPDSLVARINKKYTDDYHLTPDELSRIQPLISEMAHHTYQVRHQFGLDIMSTLDVYHQKIAEQLSPEHRAAYEKDIAERRKKLAGMLLDQSSPTPGSK